MSRAWFLNLGPPSESRPYEACADLEAILATGPGLVLGCEAVGDGGLAKAPKGYVRIRDRSTPGRDNLYAYVKDETGECAHKWRDCKETFPRAQHPHLGPHPPRAILRFSWRGAQIVVAHKPPAWKGAGPARVEHDEYLAKMMNPEPNRQRARLLFWDCNGMAGAQELADRVDGRVVGDKIDSAVVRKVTVEEWSYKRAVQGHYFSTDHPWGAFFLRFQLPA